LRLLSSFSLAFIASQSSLSVLFWQWQLHFLGFGLEAWALEMWRCGGVDVWRLVDWLAGFGGKQSRDFGRGVVA